MKKNWSRSRRPHYRQRPDMLEIKIWTMAKTARRLSSEAMPGADSRGAPYMWISEEGLQPDD